ncbi:ArsR/SmtB family transcription factor [Nocardia inohanensis]|uniref:ArsR/SmtB family transcription factor n=1 Tax=Nocardia inohanensis TaxID=209246 RepID=UPI0009FC0649|nr:helix-turn-helix transcriptional regulator [Nocardia inohanensis]
MTDTAATQVATGDALPEVAPLPAVLAALQDPVRLEMVRRLGAADGPQRCSLLYDSVSKSTAAHHFKILREAGITARDTTDGNTYVSLRADDMRRALPGLLDAVLEAANRAHTG